MTISNDEDWEYTTEGIDYSLDTTGKIPEYARGTLARALSLLPHEVIDFIVENYVILSDDDDTLGTHWTFDCYYFKDKVGFINLNSNLWKKSEIQIAFIVTHEVAHAVKGHRILSGGGFELEVKQEVEADTLAVEWLKKYYKVKDLKKLCHYIKYVKEYNKKGKEKNKSMVPKN